MDNGNILTYSYTEKSFIFCKGENLNKIIYNKKINIEKEIIYFEFNKIENCKNWFYGFHNYLINTKRKYKIISVTGFIINNLKMKMNPSSKETFVKLILKKLKTD